MEILVDKKWYNWGMVLWCYDYEGQQFDTIDEAMEAKVFDGKSLVDIWEDIFPQVS